MPCPTVEEDMNGVQGSNAEDLVDKKQKRLTGMGRGIRQNANIKFAEETIAQGNHWQKWRDCSWF